MKVCVISTGDKAIDPDKYYCNFSPPFIMKGNANFNQKASENIMQTTTKKNFFFLQPSSQSFEFYPWALL